MAPLDIIKWFFRSGFKLAVIAGLAWAAINFTSKTGGNSSGGIGGISTFNTNKKQ